MPTHYPLEGGCYTVKKDGTICTNEEADEAEASKFLPETESESTEVNQVKPKRKGK